MLHAVKQVMKHRLRACCRMLGIQRSHIWPYCLQGIPKIAPWQYGFPLAWVLDPDPATSVKPNLVKKWSSSSHQTLVRADEARRRPVMESAAADLTHLAARVLQDAVPHAATPPRVPSRGSQEQTPQDRKAQHGPQGSSRIHQTECLLLREERRSRR